MEKVVSKSCVTLVLWLATVLVGCSSGGGGGEGSKSAPQYSITLSESTVTFHVPFGGTASTPRRIDVSYVGDALSIGPPPGDSPDPLVLVQPIDVRENSATVELSTPSGFSLGDQKYHSSILRFTTGNEDGTASVYKDLTVTLVQADGFEVLDLSSNVFSGVWGSGGAVNFEVGTLDKAWTVTSPSLGVVISPSSGRGRQTVSVGYLTSDTPVGSSEKIVTFTAETGETFSRKITYQLSEPDFTDVLIEPIVLSNQVLGQSLSSTTLDLSFQNNVAVQWSAVADPWISLISAKGISGQQDLEFYVDSSAFPMTAELMAGTIKVNYDMPGASVSREYPVRFPYEPFYLQASPSAAAYTDYGATQSHQGQITVNARLSSAHEVTSTVPWIIIDRVMDNKISYHLDAMHLDLGFHEGAIYIGGSGSNGLIATEVNVGYYKSDSLVTFGAGLDWPAESFAIADRLGPWLYVARSALDGSNKIVKYNYISKTLDSSLELPDFPAVSALVVSDDGKTLYGIGYDSDQLQGKLLKIDLKNFADYSIIDIESIQRPDTVQFARFNGRSMVSDGLSWFDADSGATILYGGNNSNFRYSKTGEFFLSPGRSLRGGIGFAKYTYSYLNNDVGSSSLGDIIIESQTPSLSLSQNESWLILVTASANRRDNGIVLYGVESSIGAQPELIQRGQLAFGQLSEYPWADVNDMGVSAIMTEKYDSDLGDWERKITIRDKHLAVTVDHVIDPSRYGQRNWCTFSGDGKIFTFLERNSVDPTGTMYILSTE